MKQIKIFSLIAIVLIAVFSSSCSESETKTKGYAYCESDNANHKGNDFKQYTPKQAQWCTFQTKVFKAGHTSHAPDGFKLMSKADWEKCKWDGKTINPEKLSKKQLHEALFPVKGMMRGMRELFYKHKPFKDEKNPSKAEVDEWHRLLITHFRTMLGYKGPENDVKNSYTASMKVLWSDELKFTTKWDHTPAAKKTDKKKAHAGFTFTPSEEEQKEYYPYEGFKLFKSSSAEGVSGTRTSYPWSVKLSFTLSNYIKQEGFWGGHVGPFIRREKLGYSFWDQDKDKQDSWTTVRDLGMGKLRPFLHDYEKNPFPKGEK